MSTKKETAADFIERLVPLDVRIRPMFGEYCLYCDDKVVGFICDDTLFIKPSPGSDEFLGELDLAPAYPGSKDYHMVSGDEPGGDPWLIEMIQRTADALPRPKKARQS